MKGQTLGLVILVVVAATVCALTIWTAWKVVATSVSAAKGQHGVRRGLGLLAALYVVSAVGAIGFGWVGLLTASGVAVAALAVVRVARLLQGSRRTRVHGAADEDHPEVRPRGR